MVDAVLASGNRHKLAELQRVLGDWRIEALAADEPEETGDTYRENALLKARFGRDVAPAGAWVLAEDSGIECVALNGAPGLYSARWAAGRDPVEVLLERLEHERERGARMVSELAAVAPDGRVFYGRGVMEGAIASAPRGEGGFGYDPIFMPVGIDRTVAELGDAWKVRHSHRARAARALAAAVAGSDHPPGS